MWVPTVDAEVAGGLVVGPAVDEPVFAKALESLDSGTGVIRVLLWAR